MTTVPVWSRLSWRGPTKQVSLSKYRDAVTGLQPATAAPELMDSFLNNWPILLISVNIQSIVKNREH